MQLQLLILLQQKAKKEHTCRLRQFLQVHRRHQKTAAKRPEDQCVIDWRRANPSSRCTWLLQL